MQSGAQFQGLGLRVRVWGSQFRVWGCEFMYRWKEQGRVDLGAWSFLVLGSEFRWHLTQEKDDGEREEAEAAGVLPRAPHHGHAFGHFVGRGQRHIAFVPHTWGEERWTRRAVAPTVESGLRRERCRRVLGAWRSKDSWCRFLMGLEGDLSQGLGNEHAGVGPCTQRQAWNRTPPSAQTSRLVGRGGLLVARDVHAPCRVRVERRTVRWWAPSGIAILRMSCSRHRA